MHRLSSRPRRRGSALGGHVIDGRCRDRTSDLLLVSTRDAGTTGTKRILIGIQGCPERADSRLLPDVTEHRLTTLTTPLKLRPVRVSGCVCRMPTQGDTQREAALDAVVGQADRHRGHRDACQEPHRSRRRQRGTAAHKGRGPGLGE
jgi:hypothetical protein